MTDTIKFYSSRHLYKEFSNFHPAPITASTNVTYPTTEHYYQATKWGPPSNWMHDFVRNAKTPSNSKERSRLSAGRWTPPAERVLIAEAKKRAEYEGLSFNESKFDKVNVMRKAIQLKFSQHPKLKGLLVGSSKKLEEASSDPFWGIGKDGSGANTMGVLLMELRDELKKSRV